MDKNFDTGFRKYAFGVGTAASIAVTLAMPSINKRLVQNTFEMSKRQAMGLPIDQEAKGIFGALGVRVNKDLDSVSQMKGFRKKFNEFFMREGPTSILYAPAQKGRQLGRALDSAAREAPILRNFLADVTSVHGEKAEEAMKGLSSKLKMVKRLRNPRLALIGAGIVGLGVGFARGAKKEDPVGVPSSAPNYQDSRASQRL